MRKIILGSGGSAFSDGGLGAIHALNVFDFELKNGMMIKPDEVPTINIG